MTKRDLVLKHRETILSLAAKHGMTDLRLFGSAARGDDTPDSDLDFLVFRVDLLTDHPGMRRSLKENILRDDLTV